MGVIRVPFVALLLASGLEGAVVPAARHAAAPIIRTRLNRGAARTSLPPAYRPMLARLVRSVGQQEGSEAAWRVWSAFVFAARHHRRQFRRSGEPYITHPLSVASLLAELQLDEASIMTGLLHDSVEDTSATLDEVESRFGPEVSTLVDGVTKLTQLELRQEMLRTAAADEEPSLAFPRLTLMADGVVEPSSAQKQAANLRKLVLAMSADIRVLLVKLTDRLHNMRTLGAVPKADSRRLKAEETLSIFAPLALRVGMSGVANELEALAFAELHPHEAEAIAAAQATAERPNAATLIRSSSVNAIADGLRAMLNESGCSEVEVEVLPSSAYRVWRRVLQRQPRAPRGERASPPQSRREHGAGPRGGSEGSTSPTLPAPSMCEAIRFVLRVADRAQCYHALGVVHAHCRALGDIKDYISTPKPNHYQSLHTTVLWPAGGDVAEAGVIDVMIRTPAMQAVAERGVVAYWRQQQQGQPGQQQQQRRRQDARIDWGTDSGSAPLDFGVEQADDASGDRRGVPVDAPADESAPWSLDTAWLRSLRSMSELQPDDFIEAAQLELLPDQVFCFTPRGDIISLPRGSTPLDFAYAIHVELGSHCHAARVNGRAQSVHAVLRNGDLVEIVTRSEQTAPVEWADLAASGRARTEIRRSSRSRRRREAEAVGRRVLETALAAAESDAAMAAGGSNGAETAGGWGARVSDEQVLRATRRLPGLADTACAADAFRRLGEGKIAAADLLALLHLDLSADDAT